MIPIYAQLMPIYTTDCACPDRQTLLSDASIMSILGLTLLKCWRKRLLIFDQDSLVVPIV